MKVCLRKYIYARCYYFNKMITVNRAVALRVSELLAEKQLTQYRLEQNSGLSHGRLGCIMREKNKTVTLSTVMLLAYGFGITLIEFLDSPYFTSDELIIN